MKLKRLREIEIAVTEQGKGLPLVWGHNLLGSMRVDDAIAQWRWNQIAERVRLVRYDARGHGLSDGSYDPEDYRWSNLAQDMLAVAGATGSERFVLAGTSMGSASALEATLQAPHRVAGLVLVLPPTGWQTRPRQARFYRRFAHIVGVTGTLPYRLLELLPQRPQPDAKRALELATARGLAAANPNQVQAALRGAALSDLPEMKRLRELDVPTAMFTWTGDDGHPISTATQLSRLLPDVRVFEVSAPTAVSAWTGKLCGFLDEIAGTPKQVRRRA